MKKIILGVLALTGLLQVRSQDYPFVRFPAQLQEEQFAFWIGPPAGRDLGVFCFRKLFELQSVPAEFTVHVSADNRYKLYVNGQQVSRGPAVDDLYHWNYETVDLAPHLKKGRNVVAAQVWNPGRLKGTRQISHRTAFILQGATAQSRQINTDRTWVMARDSGYHFNPVNSSMAGGGYIAGATDSVAGQLHIWDWALPGCADENWQFAEEIGKGNHAGLDTWHGTPWLLKQRTIPRMEQRQEPQPEIVRITGTISEYPDIDHVTGLTIPPYSRAIVLLDQKALTMGFPRISFSGGRGGKIRIRYQEAMFDPGGKKGDRNNTEGKQMKGYCDVVLPDGPFRIFEPLWIRVFRFMELTLETGADTLTIHDLHNVFTAYPFEQIASFESDDPSLEPVWDASWRTARLCALETYMDCPYYEQLQYIGDTRIQALISLYVTGDDRLVRNALTQFLHSLQPMGLTQSRYPADGRQIIPPFSLYFIAMVHDYHMLRDDPEFIREFLPGIRFILDWFIGRIDENGMLGPLTYWNHIDGGTRFRAGSPPGIDGGGSAHMTLLLSYALDRAADLFGYYGSGCDVEGYRELSTQLRQSTLDQCFDADRGLVAGTPAGEIFSQHTNIFAILTGLFDEPDTEAVAMRLLGDDNLIQTTLYFRFYLFQALYKAGLGNEIPEQLDRWTGFLEKGLTTFPEHGVESRSDCHAWSAHPMYDLLAFVCGIQPAGPGFGSVRIGPCLGDLKEVSASMPHPRGMIRVHYRVNGKGRLAARITLPEGLHGLFVWNDVEYPISGGNQKIHTE